jgi:uncharacterized protein YxeA
MMKKLDDSGVSLSINTVIILVLALLVLVAMSVFFIKNISKADQTTTGYVDKVEAQAECGKTLDFGSKEFNECVEKVIEAKKAAANKPK